MRMKARTTSTLRATLLRTRQHLMISPSMSKVKHHRYYLWHISDSRVALGMYVLVYDGLAGVAD
jgi:hypothetical protein